jgi:hypothetical protein
MVTPSSKVTVKAALLRWTSALPRTIKAHLREDGDVIAELQVMAPAVWGQPLACVCASRRSPAADPQTKQALPQLASHAHVHVGGAVAVNPPLSDPCAPPCVHPSKLA